MRIEELMGTAHSVQITATRKENDSVVTLEFEMSNPATGILPGEFLMIWVPGVDEIPMSIASWNPPIASITVKIIGEATNALATLVQGDWIGIRGPFGNHFTQDAKSALVVGGGIGMAPLRLLTHRLLTKGAEVHLVVGARTKKELVLYDLERIANARFHLHIATDDGSAGQQGFATDSAKTLIGEHSFDKVYTCGPEIMMAKLYEIVRKNGIGLEASLERYMKCGCGICGTCGIDPGGELVCIDGPIFTRVQLDKMSDFGRSYRDSTGQKREF